MTSPRRPAALFCPLVTLGRLRCNASRVDGPFWAKDEGVGRLKLAENLLSIRNGAGFGNFAPLSALYGLTGQGETTCMTRVLNLRDQEAVCRERAQQ
ncbi:MAG: hypothetical protein MZV49_08040 [Rhodopseudomonas palustris]|nr:hypothetical protein [Rhodopseudomonas palustris]